MEISVDYCMVSGKKDSEKRVLLKESHIPRLIIWVPIISIIITALIISSLFIASYNQFRKFENINLRNRLLEEGRLIIRDEIEEIIDYIDFNVASSEKWLTKELKSRADCSYSIIESIYEQNYTSKSEVEIIDMIRETLRNVRFFDGRGYYFIHRYDLDSKDYTILQPNMPGLEGDYQLDYRDLDGRLISKEVYNLLESDGEGFLSFYFYLDDQNKKEKKLAYMKLFKPLNIFVGAGEYIHYYKEEIKKNVLLRLENYRYGDSNYL